MQYDEASIVFHQIQAATRENPVLRALTQEFLAAAVRYARLRTEWALQEPAQRQDMDRARTLAHTRFIDACNILSRTMRHQGHDISWRARVGQQRGEIGDFACYVHCLLGLAAR
jgi:hypothetical protein